MFVRVLLVFLIIHFAGGFVLNILGWVTMSKIVVSAGLRGYYLALLLGVGVYVIMDYILIMSSYFDKINKAFEVNLNRIRTKILVILAFFAIAYWLYMYLDYLYVDSYVFAFLSDVVMQERTIGSATFSLGFGFNICWYFNIFILRLRNDKANNRSERFYESGYSAQ